nr:uncharacterized protein [Tanacetum cinerariifolium]
RLGFADREFETEKEMWEAIKTPNIEVDRVKEARLQTLITELENLKMLDNGTIDEYAAKLSGIASKSATLGEVVSKHKQEDGEAHTLEVVDEVEIKDVVGETRKTKCGHFVLKCPKRNRNHEVNLNERQEKGVYHEEGIEVSQGKDCVEIKQERYAMMILKEAGMEDCIATLCPMEPGLKLSKAEDEPEVKATQYRKMVIVEHVSRDNQRADLLTKALARIRFKEMRSLLGVQELPSSTQLIQGVIVGEFLERLDMA